MNDLLLHRIDLMFIVWVDMICHSPVIIFYLDNQYISDQGLEKFYYVTLIYTESTMFVLNLSSRLLTFQHFRQYPNEASYCRCD